MQETVSGFYRNCKERNQRTPQITDIQNQNCSSCLPPFFSWNKSFILAAMLLPSIQKKCAYSGARVCARSVRTDPVESRKKNGTDNLIARRLYISVPNFGWQSCRILCLLCFCIFSIRLKSAHPRIPRRLDDGKLATPYVWLATRFTYPFFCMQSLYISLRNAIPKYVFNFSPCRNPSQTDENKFCKGKF